MRHVIVVGSGIAGLIASLELSRKYEVTLVTKARLADSNTRWAQGGIAAAMFADDSAEEHIADTLRAGAGLCDSEAVKVLCTEGPERIRDLIRIGVSFDRHEGELARGLEAAHSHARILHAGGDATGLSIEMALVHAVRAAEVTVLEHTFAVDLLLREGIVRGLEIIAPDGAPRQLRAEAVVLASGGAGQLYRHTTNPAVATGDGAAIALRAGAQVADTEFYQFHPTALATSASDSGTTFLISEAVRGEGAVLLDSNGRRFMQTIDQAAELAPRDVVARGIARQMAAQGGEAVFLDATRLGSSFLATRFPTIDEAVRRRGYDWSVTPIPVTPAAHYWMGGVRTDIFGRTSVPGLYAVGEVACTGVHGANRLASNSLLESLVFAWRCAHLLLSQDLNAANGVGPSAVLEDTCSLDLREVFLEVDGGIPVDRATLRDLMWNCVGIERSRQGLKIAEQKLQSWKGDISTIHGRETANLLSLGRVMVAAALAREESRGAHFREDFPETLAAFQHSLVYCSEVPVRC